VMGLWQMTVPSSGDKWAGKRFSEAGECFVDTSYIFLGQAPWQQRLRAGPPEDAGGEVGADGRTEDIGLH
jgi:hypothetical protein